VGPKSGLDRHCGEEKVSYLYLGIESRLLDHPFLARRSTD
jgi:hypothetical protein